MLQDKVYSLVWYIRFAVWSQPVFPVSPLANSRFLAHSTYFIFGSPWSRATLVLFLFFLPSELPPILQNPAEMSPTLWRFPPTNQTEPCSPLCFANTHTHTHIMIIILILLHPTLSSSLKQPPPTNLARSMPLTLKHPMATKSGLEVWGTLAHPFLLPAVELMLRRTNCICSQTFLYPFYLYLLLSLFSLIAINLKR